MLDTCDFYLPSTCFSGMQAYNRFEELPYARGYGVVIHKDRAAVLKAAHSIDWRAQSFLSTNSASNLRKSLIEDAFVAL